MAFSVERVVAALTKTEGMIHAEADLHEIALAMLPS
jgi:hypothetical protein